MSTRVTATDGGTAAAATGRPGRPTPAPPALSIVITTDGDLRSLGDCLSALDRQAEISSGSVEVIVVADGSPATAQHTLRSLGIRTPLTVIEQARSGHASARNAGWLAARGGHVLFLGSSVVAGPQLLAAHLAAHQGKDRLVVLGQVKHDPSSEASPWQAYDDSVLAKKYAGLGVSEAPSGIHNGDHFSLAQRLLVEVGGYRSAMSVDSDVDLGVRLKAVGAEFVYRPDAEAFQRINRDYADWLRMHRIRGRFEVAEYRDRGYRGGIESLVGCFHDRRLLIRLVVRLALARQSLGEAILRVAESIGNAAWRLRQRRLALMAMSCVANILYWRGVGEGLRSKQTFWRLVHDTRHTRERPYQPLQTVPSAGHPPASAKDHV